MTSLEIIIYPFLVFGFGAICYICGKGDLLNVMSLMLQDKAKDLEERLNDTTEEDKNNEM